MSGKEILVDTNIILYLLNGSETLANFLQGKNIYFSFITELELIDFKENKSEELQISELLDDCSIIQLNEKIKAK
jgi:predicted nucleic acid-binding protein